MSKFYGAVGYVQTSEVRPSIWEETITEKMYCGDLLRNSRRLNSSDRVNDNVEIANTVSIIADPYAYQNFHAMRYVEFMGAKWRVTSVEVQYPRLILTIGGVYNENET